MRQVRRLLVLVSFLSTPALANSASPPVNADLDRLQAQFNSTTKDLVKNMNVVSADARKCSIFGGALSSAIASPTAAIPPGVAKINASLSKLKTSVAGVGASQVVGVDIAAGSAKAVKTTQKQIATAIALPLASIDDVIPVVDDGVRQMSESRERALGLLSGGAPACEEGRRAFQAMYGSAVTAQHQLKEIRGALEAQKTSLLRWTNSIQGSLVSNP